MYFSWMLINDHSRWLLIKTRRYPHQQKMWLILVTLTYTLLGILLDSYASGDRHSRSMQVLMGHGHGECFLTFHNLSVIYFTIHNGNRKSPGSDKRFIHLFTLKYMNCFPGFCGLSGFYTLFCLWFIFNLFTAEPIHGSWLYWHNM